MSKKKRKYPLAGLGLSTNEEKELEEKLIVADLKLNWVQRRLIQMWMKGEVEIKIE